MAIEESPVAQIINDALAARETPEQLLEKIQDSGAFVACIMQRTQKSLELLKQKIE